MSGWEAVAYFAAAAVSAVGAVSAAQSQSNAAKYNEEIAKQNAASAELQGQAAAEMQQRDVQRRLGSAVALYGAAGVDVSGGSPADALSDSARRGALDSLTIKYNAHLRALGLNDQANLDEANASNSSTAGYLNAFGTLIGGAAGAYGRYKTGGGTQVPGTGQPVTG